MPPAAADPGWETKPTKTSQYTYSIKDGKLSAKKRDGFEILAALGVQKDAVTSAVKQLEVLIETRKERSLEEYERGLFSYLTRMLGRLLPMLQKNNWDAVKQTLQDFKGREALHLTHDLEGRRQYQDRLETGKQLCNNCICTRLISTCSNRRRLMQLIRCRHVKSRGVKSRVKSRDFATRTFHSPVQAKGGSTGQATGKGCP